MKAFYYIFGILIFCTCGPGITIGQTLITDSCGVNSSPFLNKYEIDFVDSVLFHPFPTRKSGMIDPKKGFDFTSKKIAFFSCTLYADNNGKGFMTKQQFFNLVKPTPIGHAGIGLEKLSANEKINTKGFDAVIIIDCPYQLPSRKKFISALANFSQ